MSAATRPSARRSSGPGARRRVEPVVPAPAGGGGRGLADRIGADESDPYALALDDGRSSGLGEVRAAADRSEPAVAQAGRASRRWPAPRSRRGGCWPTDRTSNPASCSPSSDVGRRRRTSRRPGSAHRRPRQGRLEVADGDIGRGEALGHGSEHGGRIVCTLQRLTHPASQHDVADDRGGQHGSRRRGCSGRQRIGIGFPDGGDLADRQRTDTWGDRVGGDDRERASILGHGGDSGGRTGGGGQELRCFRDARRDAERPRVVAERRPVSHFSCEHRASLALRQVDGAAGEVRDEGDRHVVRTRTRR